jgi:uncharacterized membrane protein YeaQ/YmgE (transglycosylase-associated protein family)
MRAMWIIVLILVGVIVLFLIAGAVVGFVFKLLWWIIIGVIIGALARLLVPGKQTIGWLATAGVGIAGALLGGIIAHAIDVGGFLQFLIAVALAAVGVLLLEGGTRGKTLV